ncbi:MAG: hypothetical protein GX189_03855 [Clostridiales bacterium]|nr:hypothetical protein [Clostridiales bacterium]
MAANRISPSAGGDTPSLDGAPSSAEHENRFSSNKAAPPAAESGKEQDRARKTERKKR